ncbi:DNA topoisomerase [Pseudomonas sp. S1(2024)]|uniref:DNA topoisomerase n=1 Tax=Pseudomonas sp. S1(2024) TaxID=3390191 RepID=UPI00397D08F0
MMRKNRIWVIEAPGKVDSLRAALKDAGFLHDRILATYGRLYDLPEDRLALDPNNPHIVAWQAKRPDQIRKLKGLIESADEVLIATDSDIEGELIASQVAHLCLKDQIVDRVHLVGFSAEHVEQAELNRMRIDADRVCAAKARRLFDRHLGFMLTAEDDKWRMSMGRITTPIVRSLQDDPAEAVVIDKALPDGWHAIMRLPTTQSVHAETVLGLLHALPTPVIEVFRQEQQVFECKPLTGPEALSLCCRSLKEPLNSVLESLQRNYEKGKLSYPRSDSRKLGEVSMRWAERMAQVYSRPFDREVAAFRQGEKLARSYEAHEAVMPMVEDVPDSSIPTSSLSTDEAVLRVIAMHSMRLGEPGEVFTRETGKLQLNDDGRRWEHVLRSWKGSLEFVRDTDPLGDLKHPLRNELARPADTHQAGVSLWRHEVGHVVMERLVREELGRPSTIKIHAQKTAHNYLDRYGVVNGRGQLMLKLVAERSPELVKPLVAVKIEEVLTQKAPGLSIDARLQSAWKVLKQAPLGSTGKSKGHSPAPATPPQHSVEVVAEPAPGHTDLDNSPSPI